MKNADNQPAAAWLTDALKSIGDAVIATDAAGYVRFLNPVAAELTGWSSQEAIGQPLADIFRIVNEQTRAPVENPFNKVIATGNCVGLANHTLLISRDGTERPIDDSAAPIKDDHGHTTGVILIFRDMTEKRQASELKNHLAAIVESSDDVIISKDLNGIITSWNRAAEKILGFRAEEAIGQHISLIMPPEHVDDAAKILGRIRRGERVEHYETKRRRKDGTVIDVSLTVSPIRRYDGTIIGASKVARDITDRKRADERLAESEQRFRALVTATSDVVYRMSPDWAEMHHLMGRDFIADTLEPSRTWLEEYIPPGERQRVLEVIGEAIRTKSIFQLEHQVMRADGSIGWTFSRAVPILNANGEIQEWFGAATDVTQRRQAAEAAQQLAEELRIADRRKDEFLAMLAHELRNPLASVSNAIQLLRMPKFPAEHAEWAKEVIQRQVKHLARMIDDLMDVSRITRGKIELRKERIEASPVIHSAIDAVRPLIGEKKQELAISFTPGTLWCEADPTRLEQILINLLTNASRYTDAGGHLWLTAHHEGDLLTFTIRDTGIGIPPEQLTRMFELFAQGDRGPARSEGGLGIGLTVVKHLAEMHGGTATAKSEGPGKGSEFTVTLPALPQPLATETAAPSLAPRPQREARILVVDDNLDTATGLARLLRLLGHDIRTAHDGPSAVAEALAFRPEFILLDIGLPGMDGYQVARQLRQEGLHDTIIIAISGYGQEEDRRRSEAAGFDHHLVKPVDYNALIPLITQPC